MQGRDDPRKIPRIDATEFLEAVGNRGASLGHPSPEDLWTYCRLGSEEPPRELTRLVEDHLSSCAECRELLGKIKDVEKERESFGTVAGSAGGSDSRERAKRIRSIFFSEQETVEILDASRKGRIDRPTRTPLVAVLAAAAATVLLLLGVWIGGRGEAEPLISTLEFRAIGTTRSSDEGESLRVGDFFRLVCSVKAPCWICSFALESDRDFTSVVLTKEGGNLVGAGPGELVDIPCEPFRFQLTEDANDEAVILVIALEKKPGEALFEGTGAFLSKEWNRSSGDGALLREALESRFGPGQVRIYTVPSP